ncbi:hypothetical protein MAPG_10163 [Magnaporthiopsis poae ATCC 64411]|uniref:Uncharacterized protein n=1 Tax=Magnaporthiopsis poae (strain ATCC 64411 / 73-15) TaxID=644358 RepID=A0A0C4EBV4_MAGP6|nr:hypothetical protein MAPG_10163 [Magnaporthiopsis poae ATCC 64411]
MAISPRTPTPAPTPTRAPDTEPQDEEIEALRARGVIAPRAITYAPLQTPWVQPASCSGNIPTIIAGTCNTKTGCSAYPTSSMPRALASGARVNQPHFTTSRIMTSTECMPPGYLALESFFFTSATGCPTGFVTAATSSYYSTLRVGCCPSNFPTATWASGEGVWDCYSIKSVTQGEIFTLAARGMISVSAANLDFWYSESIIGTTAWPTPTTAYIMHPAVNLIYSTSTPSPGFGVSSSGAIDTVFTMFGLGLAASIAIVVVIAIVGIVLVVCLCCCCVRLIRGRKTTVIVPPPAPAPYYGQPYAPGPQQPYSTPPPPQQQQQQQFAPYQPPPQQFHGGTPPPAFHEQKYPNAELGHA